MQEAKEANPHAKAKHRRILWLKLQGAITQAQLLNRFFQVIVIFVAHREKPRIDKGLDFFIAREGLKCNVWHIAIIACFDGGVQLLVTTGQSASAVFPTLAG